MTRTLMIKWLLVLTTALAFFASGDFTYAQTPSQDATLTMDVAQAFDIIIWFMSWGWVILANIAWKLMTNDLVYGEFINLDNILFQLWNVSKNFANFGLGFFFLYHIIRYFFSQDDAVSTIWKTLWKVLIWAIWIQMSWFVVGATIDVSTILTTAISSFPNIIIEQDAAQQATIIKNMKALPSRVTLQNNSDIKERPIKNSTKIIWDSDISDDAILDIIAPTANNISWPLLYIGFTTLHIQDYMTLTLDSPSWEKPIWLMVTILLKFWLLIAFTFALFLLIIVNVFRVLYLWLVIAFAPLGVLAWVIWFDGWWGWNSITKDLNVWNIIKLIFTPAIYVAFLWITLIIVVTMQKVLLSTTAQWADNCNRSIAGIELCYDNIAKKSSFNVDGLDSGITIEWEILPAGIVDGSKNVFTSLLITLFTLGLLFAMIWIMVKSWSTIWQPYAEQAIKTAKSVAWSVPIIPFAGWQSAASLSAGATNFQRNAIAKAGRWSNLWVQRFEEYLDSKLGLAKGISRSDREEVRKMAWLTWDFNINAASNPSKFLNFYKWLISDDKIEEYIINNSWDSIVSDLNTWFEKNAQYVKWLAGFQSFKAKFDNTDAIKGIDTFANSLTTAERNSFLNWLHKELGGKWWDFSTYDKFIKTPIKAKVV